MASGIKAMFGMAPKDDGRGGFTPSSVALKLATKSKTDYDHAEYPDALQGSTAKVLMVCTEERYMTMAKRREVFHRQSPGRNDGAATAPGKSRLPDRGLHAYRRTGKNRKVGGARERRRGH